MKPLRPGSTTDEVHDLQPVPIPKLGCRPSVPWDDLTVQFHRYPIRLYAQLFKQGRKTKSPLEGVRLAINLNFH